MKITNTKSCTFSKENDAEFFYQDMFFIEMFQKTDVESRSKFGIFKNHAIIPFLKDVPLNAFILLGTLLILYPRT